MTIAEIVQELDRHILGQYNAKRAVAIALSNRWRRMQVDDDGLLGDHAEKHSDDRPHRGR